MSKHVLIVGFEPFGGSLVNPSEMLVNSFTGMRIADRQIATSVLPVESRSLGERLGQVLLEVQADIIIGFGQAAGRAAISLERVAVNVLDFDQPDNVGVTRNNDQIVRGGPDARLSNLPFDKIVEAWHANGVPSYTSNSAGTFICNQFLYELLGRTENASPPVIAGFVHLPYLPSQAISVGSQANPSMSFDLMKKAAELLIETLVPWVDNRTPEPTRPRDSGKPQMWIPRGIKEAER
ncbi:MAG: pyroglutamyl-peptidase I [Vulcanimicrobiaceae bacterium]